MPMISHRRTGRVLLLAAALSCCAPAWAQPLPPGVEPPRPSEQVVSISNKDSKVALTELQTRILELGNKIRSVDGHDPDILTIIPVSNHRIRLRAEKPGVTTFTLTDEFDNVYSVEVFVDADVRELQAYLGRLFPGAAIEVVGLNGSVVLRGWVTEPQQINQITDVAEKFSPNVLNQMNVGGVSQVQLQVKVMEVQRSKLRQLGFNFLVVGQNGYFASTPGSLAPVASATLPFGGPPSVTIQPNALANSSLQWAITGSDTIFQSFLEAIETNSLAKVLADTALVTNSGRPATLVAGGQFPVLVPQQLGTVTVEYREFGVRMEAVPIVLGNGRLKLDVAPEVSERDVSSAVVVNGFTVPGITLRRVNTQVEMRFGETLMLGGLILQRETETRSKIPFLGDMPWIGSAFSRRRSEVAETELLIMVTPQMVAPITCGQLPISGPGTNTEPPSDHEFYFDGHMEVPNYNPSGDTLSGWTDAGPVGGAPGAVMPAMPVEPGPATVPPAGSPPAPAPAADASAAPPVKDEAVTPTSGVKEPVRKERSTTIGTMNPFRLNRRTLNESGTRNGASVKSNTGDDLRKDAAASGAAATDKVDTAGNARRLELFEPSTNSLKPRTPLSAEPPPRG